MSVPGTTIDRACGSGQQAVHFAAQAVRSGEYVVVVAAGGVESMSRTDLGPLFHPAAGPGPHYGERAQNRFSGGLGAQGPAAEEVSHKWGLTRAELDEYSLRSSPNMMATWFRVEAHLRTAPPLRAASDSPGTLSGMGVRRILLACAIVLVGGGGVVTGVSVDDDADERPGRSAIVAPTPPKVTVALPSGPVGPTAEVTATASQGTLRQVSLTSSTGEQVPGELTADRRTWRATRPLDYATTYTWGGTAVDADGRTVPVAGTLATVTPAKRVRATFNIGDGRTVGVAAPIQLQFTGHVTDRAAVEKVLSVHTSVPTEGAWGWLPDEQGGSRVHWRPKQYWQPGTRVTVSAPLFGVDYGGGAWGAAAVDLTFTIGRAQITKADVDSHQLVVTRDGVEVATYPASYGLDSDPERNTRSGIHVITEKFTDKRMVSERYDYDVVEKWAVRMSNNGEFIHANPATAGVQGSSNVSHGCVNLSLEDAEEFYRSAMYGDPVEVTGSGVDLSARDGDIWVWTVPWERWRTYSALD